MGHVGLPVVTWFKYTCCAAISKRIYFYRIVNDLTGGVCHLQITVLLKEK
jgi:hypothetical protein